MVKHESTVWGDTYTGTRAALIAAGICKAAWFPTAPVAFERRPGNIKRSFDIGEPIKTAHYSQVRYAVLRQVVPYKNDVWEYRQPCGEEEEKRREKLAEAEREREEEKGQREKIAKDQLAETAKEQRIAAAIKALPPFVPGSMTEGEKHLMRVVRGLHDFQSDWLLDMAERLLDRADEFTEVVSAATPKGDKPEAPKPGLRLVVNNEGAK